MGTIMITDPGTDLTSTEYLGNLNTIAAEFNGNIDNANIKTAANIDSDKIGVTRTQNKIFTGGVVISFPGNTGLVVSDGLTVSNGLTTLQGGLSIGAAGINIINGGLTVANSSGVGITVTAGGLTVTAGGLTVTAGGMTIDAGGMAINAGGLTVLNGTVTLQGGLSIGAAGINIIAGGLTLSSGNAVNIKGTSGIDYNTGGVGSDIDLITEQPGLNKLYWDNTAVKFAVTSGFKIDSGGLAITAGGFTLSSGTLTISSNDLVMTTGNINLAALATVDGVDVSAHVTNADVHHATLHSIASHNDTIGTGAELDILTNGSDADSLHTHPAHPAVISGTHGNVPRFSTGKSGNQLINTTNELIVWDSAILDSHSSLSSSIFQPSTAGTYIISCGLTFSAASVGNFTITLRKTGVGVQTRTVRVTTAGVDYHISVSDIITMNGSADTVTIVATSSNNDATIQGLLESNFKGTRITLT